jgi:hypothetical protein
LWGFPKHPSTRERGRREYREKANSQIRPRKLFFHSIKMKPLLVYLLLMVVAVTCFDTQIYVKQLTVKELGENKAENLEKSSSDLMREANEIQKIADVSADVLLKYKENSNCQDCDRSKLELQEKIRLDQAAAQDAQRAADEARKNAISEQRGIQKGKDDTVKSFRMAHDEAVETLNSKLFDLNELYSKNLEQLLNPEIPRHVEKELKDEIGSFIDDVTAAYDAVETTGNDYKNAMSDAENYSASVMAEQKHLIDGYLTSIQSALFNSDLLKSALEAKVKIAAQSPDNIFFQSDVDIAQSVSDNAKLMVENLQKEIVDAMEYFISVTRDSVARSYNNANEMHRITAEAEGLMRIFISSEEKISKQVCMLSLFFQSSIESNC